MAAVVARTTGAELDAATMAAVLARHRPELELSDVGATGPSWGRDDGTAPPFAPPF